MLCPNCDRPNYDPTQACPECQFSGDSALIEELAHVDWVLDEIATWQLHSGVDRQNILDKYLARQRELEIQLGLRLPPFTEEQAREAWPDLFRREALRRALAEWLESGLTHPPATQTLVDQVNHQIEELLEQLEGHPRPAYPRTDADHLDLTNFLLEAVDHLSQADGFVAAEVGEQVRGNLLAQKERLEINLGLRPAPTPEPREVPAEDEDRISLAALEAEARGEALSPSPELAVLPPPRQLPFRERLWRTLLSERTLQALLFLGIFLLFSAAISFVIWGWKDFSALLRVAIPTGFTVVFFALGWYVRTRTPLYRSGIALSAIAALLIPIDFYTLYVNFEIPPDYGPLFWLITSLACLVAYVVATLIIQNQLFGYLVGTAAGSTVLAMIEIGHQSFDLSLDWRTAGLSGLALCLTTLGTGKETKFFAVQKNLASSLFLFAAPLRRLSLITVGVLMPLTFGWRYIDRSTYDTLHYAMTINWWVGGFIFGWGAVYHRSRSLGLLAAISLPVATYMAQAALFNQVGINPAWHAFGWAWLVLLYFVTGHKLLAHEDDPVIYGHGRTATSWGVALLIVAAFWSLTDLTSGAAAASSHAVLTGAIILAARLWRRPRLLYGASLLSLSATTFAMTELNLTLSQLALGWASLAIAHIVVAINLGGYFAGPVVVAGYAIAGLAILPTLFPYNGDLLAYVLGNWLGLAAWGARLAHVGQPGFTARPPLRPAIFHWFTALPLPIWIWVLFANRGPLDSSLALALAALAWGMVALSYRLAQTAGAYRWPWYLAGLVVSLAAPGAAFVLAPGGFAPALCLLSAGLLYLVDAILNRQSLELAPGGWVTAWGLGLLLHRLHVSYDGVSFALALLIAAYFLAGLWAERRKSPVFNHRFLTPLYLAVHMLSFVLLWRIYIRPLYDLFRDIPWTDAMRLWGAANQLLLSIVYGLYAWGTYKERWGHAAAWMGAAGGGFIAIAYSQGRGSSAAKAAIVAVLFILAERGLYRLRQRSLAQVRARRGKSRQQAYIRLAWWLYRRPLLVTGWIVSAGAIGLALVRNLWLLGGGRIQQIWATVGLLLITGLYALSARLFRRARFMWLAASLTFAPWTILTNLGWFVFHKPTTPGFAISWVVLAWGLFLAGLVVQRTAREAQPYASPLKWVAYVLLPFSLLWGVANVDTSRFTFALAIGFYGLAAFLDHLRLLGVHPHPQRAPSPSWGEGRGEGQSTALSTFATFPKFLYPALGLTPAWCVYLMAWLLPVARHEHYGLMLLAFGPLGLAAGQWLQRIAPVREAAGGRFPKRGYGLPAYLTGYVSVIVGTLLVAHEPPLLALILLYDALLMLVSARLFRHPLWVYPATAIVPLSLLIALNEAGVAGERQGWWLIGLAAIYLALAWALRRARLPAYGTATLTAGFALIALGLPPSSRDKTGALWGYGSAASLYAITAFWLHQPLLLTPACALAIVPYAVMLQQSALAPRHYGLALFPGAIAALAMGWALDVSKGQDASSSCRDFPWGEPALWAKALADRLLNWWGLPLYALGFGLGVASPFFTDFDRGLSALNFFLLMPLFSWAIYRFRLRVWLLATALAGHLAAIYYLADLGWWRYRPYAWLRFLPVTLVTTGIAVFIERRRGEGSPLDPKRFLAGWSRPLYGLVLLDIAAAQVLSLGATEAGALITLAHALLIAVLASVWLSSWMPYISTTLGAVALLQWLSTLDGPIEGLPVALAQLALAYGLAGYGLAFKKPGFVASGEAEAPSLTEKPGFRIWESPLQRSGLWFSFVILAITAWLGLDLVGWTVRAMLGFPFRQIVRLATVQMVVGVLALLGLLYLAAAFVHRRLRLSYVALGMLLAAWMAYAFYIQQWDGAARVQWYAIPAGLYLLGIAYLEWEQGNKTLARWLDYAAMLLMMGSLFWQTMLFGWRYALLLGAEGFASFWWGSARRLRRFLYAGMIGVILATVAQLINSLRSINQWIVFGLIGLLIILAGLVVERKLEDIRAWQESLEMWE